MSNQIIEAVTARYQTEKPKLVDSLAIDLKRNVDLAEAIRTIGLIAVGLQTSVWQMTLAYHQEYAADDDMEVDPDLDKIRLATRKQVRDEVIIFSADSVMQEAQAMSRQEDDPELQGWMESSDQVVDELTDDLMVSVLIALDSTGSVNVG